MYVLHSVPICFRLQCLQFNRRIGLTVPISHPLSHSIHFLGLFVWLSIRNMPYTGTNEQCDRCITYCIINSISISLINVCHTGISLNTSGGKSVNGLSLKSKYFNLTNPKKSRAANFSIELLDKLSLRKSCSKKSNKIKTYDYYNYLFCFFFFRMV